MVHTSTLDAMKEDNPRQVRQYLNQVRDYTALRKWDRDQMKDSKDK